MLECVFFGVMIKVFSTLHVDHCCTWVIQGHYYAMALVSRTGYQSSGETVRGLNPRSNKRCLIQVCNRRCEHCLGFILWGLTPEVGLVPCEAETLGFRPDPPVAWTFFELNLYFKQFNVSNGNYAVRGKWNLRFSTWHSAEGHFCASDWLRGRRGNWF